jgi:hypothetical protein
MKKLKKLLIFVLFVSVTGCMSPQFSSQESVYVVWKTPSLKYADQGFVYRSPETVQMEIYGNGQPIMRLKINQEQICTGSLRCMDKKYFNQTVLSRWYPDSLLENVLRGKPLFGGRNLIHKRNGFTQTVVNGSKYRIDYHVLNNETVFHDTINKIQFKVVKQ